MKTLSPILRYLSLFVIFLFIVFAAFGQTSTKHVRVNGYYRKDGTYVRPHYRTAPNSTNRDNFSTYGNTNPYTGKPGWIPPDNNSIQSTSEYNTTSSSITKSDNWTETSIYTTIKSDGQLWRTPKEFDRIQYILKGTPLQVIGYENGFWKVNAFRTVGYIINETINVTPEMENMISVSNQTNSTTTKTPVNSETTYFTHNATKNTLYKYNYESKPSYYTSTDLNLRTYMSASSAIVTQIPKGAEVKVIDSFFEKWWQVYYKGQTGYVAKAYLLSEPSSAPMETDTYSEDFNSDGSDNHFVLTQETSLRTRPDSKAKVILRFEIGDEVKVLDDSGQWWWKVIFDGKTGWLKRHLLEEQ